VVVGNELEIAALTEDCGFLIDRPILETEEQTGADSIAPDHLEEAPTGSTVPSFVRKARKPWTVLLRAHRYGLS
jgi:hypothetical protein